LPAVPELPLLAVLPPFIEPAPSGSPDDELHAVAAAMTSAMSPAIAGTTSIER
jgi:hypothetical protein